MTSGEGQREMEGSTEPDTGRTLVMDREDVEETLDRLAREVLARSEEPSGEESAELALVGIRRRGVQLARRLARRLQEHLGLEVPTGSLDITLYRDDFARVGPRPVIGPTEIPFEVTDRRVVLVDDVLHTGRTVRAAMDELADFGRPSHIELCVLVDRGGRELPIQPDYVGQRFEVAAGREVAVLVPDLDGELAVYTVPV